MLFVTGAFGYTNRIAIFGVLPLGCRLRPLANDWASMQDSFPNTNGPTAAISSKFSVVYEVFGFSF